MDDIIESHSFWLSRAKPGQRLKVTSIGQTASRALRTKLMAVGFVEGEIVEVIRRAPLQSSSLAVCVRGSMFALRAADLSQISVQEIKP